MHFFEQYEVDILHEKVILLPQKALWFKARKLLLVADLHFGKINHFRKSGIPVPARANDKNTELLINLLNQTKPDRLVFLGDLFHSHYNEEWEVVGQIRKHFLACSFELVVGNHDILSALQYERHMMKVYPNELRIGDFIFTHEPLAIVPEGLYNVSGHLHPGVQLRGTGKQSMTLPCFYFGKHQGILPAFGSFTGLARISPKKRKEFLLLQKIKSSHIQMHRGLLLLIGLVFQLPLYSQDTTRLSLLFVGDIMQHDSNIAAAYNPGTAKYDYSACFEYIAPIVRSADLAIGNLELTLAGKPYKGYPQFSAPNELAYELKRVGFDVLVTANNHSVDRGKKGIEKTIDVLDTLSIFHTGTFKDSITRASTYPLIIEKNGFSLSLLNYTYGTNGIPVPRPSIVNLIDTVQLKNDLAKARTQQSDAIIVFMHWGDEYQSLPNKTQKKLTELCFREGAKLVIGAHPHVLQPMEWRKDKDQFVVYSLGNFISGQRPRYRDGGAMLWIDLKKVTSDSVSVTTIHNAEYELEWVQKSNDAKKDFVMLPFRYFESDTAFIADKLLRDAFHSFKEDSRALYAKHNVNVTERTMTFFSDSLSYSICLGSFSEENSVAVIENELLLSYSIFRKPHGNRQFLWYAGKFADRTSAVEALVEIQSKTPFKNIHVAKRIEADPPIQTTSGN